MLAVALLYCHVSRYGQREDPGRAEVIIVLGAAVWPDGPSPALQTRVRRGCTLYHQGRAPNLIFCGGLGRWPPAEAEAMAVLARSWQVDEQSIFREDQSTNTRENMANAVAIMNREGWETALIVTDYFHMKRAMLLARDCGIKSLRAPVLPEESSYALPERFYYTLRECAALAQYSLWKLSGVSLYLPVIPALDQY